MKKKILMLLIIVTLIIIGCAKTTKVTSDGLVDGKGQAILCAFERGYVDDWSKIWKSIHTDKSQKVSFLDSFFIFLKINI